MPQASPHAHAVVIDPSGHWLLSTDLGADRVFVYRFDPRTRKLTPAATPFLQLPPGTDPRHLVFSKDGRFAYLVSELSAEIRALSWDARTDALTELQRAGSGGKLPWSFALAPDGR